MPITNGEAIASLIDEATDSNPGLTETAIAERTAELGAPFGEVSARTLGRAKNNANVQKGNLLSLAAVFSQLIGREVSYETMIGPQEAKSDNKSESELSGSNHQESNAEGNNSISFNAGPGSNVNVNIYRQDYKSD